MKNRKKISDKEIISSLIEELLEVPDPESENPAQDAAGKWSVRVGNRSGRSPRAGEAVGDPSASAIPTDPAYERAVADLSARSYAFRAAIAADFAPVFNREIARHPQDTLEAKKTLCRWANAELRQFGLAIRCPKTGTVSYLIANPGNHPETGRFQIYHDAEGGKKVTTSRVSLPNLELIPAVLGPQIGHRSGKWADLQR